jgi:trk system potassium uptake protein TrkA
VKRQYVVIVGCGRFGSYLANRYSRDGSSVVVIDPNPDSFAALSADISGFTIEGNAFEYAVLRQAKTGKADLLVAASEKDSTNLFCAHVAKTHFRVPEVVARVYDPELARMYEGTGITTVSPLLIAAERFLGET